MRISFLIPTKNRLDLLKHAISSILAQAHRDFEIIVSDNASDDNYEEYIASLSDARIVYFRHPSLVPVTENWQKALSLATGDYVLMLGDDDALTPQFSEIVVPHLLSEPEGPDAAYLAAYHYCYPGVIPEVPAGYMCAVRCGFLIDAKDAFILDPGYARELAAAVLDFRHRFNFNGQHFLLKRSFAREFDGIGGLYQSPYPDFFAAIAVFYRARSILVLPREAVIIGISPESFGAYYFSRRQKDGYRFLDNENLSPDIRSFLDKATWPGDMHNTNWLIAAEMARRALGSSSLPEVNVERYRALQMIYLLRDRYVHGRVLDDVFAEWRARLSVAELITFDFLRSLLGSMETRAKRLIAPAFLAVEDQLGQYPAYSSAVREIGPHASIADAVESLKGKRLPLSIRSMTDVPVATRSLVRMARRAGGAAIRTLVPNHAEKIVGILKRGLVGIAQDVTRRVETRSGSMRDILKRIALLFPFMRHHAESVRALVRSHETLAGKLAASQVAREALAGELVAAKASFETYKNRFSVTPIGAYSPQTRDLALTADARIIVDRFHDLCYRRGQRGNHTYGVSWRGYAALKCPLDLWIYQEIIVKLQPDVIIETGTDAGGSALFLASVCDLTGHGDVISIYIDARKGEQRPVHPRLSYVNGSSTDPAIVAQVRKSLEGGRRGMVILDSDHHRDHVLAEVRMYQEFVPVGGYMIVEDTNINGHPTYPEFGPGPMEAVEEFLRETDSFEVDLACERFLLTMNPRGFLRRCK